MSFTVGEVFLFLIFGPLDIIFLEDKLSAAKFNDIFSKHAYFQW